jgi:hypothetical protein
VFFACSSCSCSASLSIRFGSELWLEVVSDSPQQQADGPRVPGGQSACSPRTVHYSGSSLEVLVAFSNGPRRRAGQSMVWVRTVRGSRPDGPRGSSGQSAPPGRTIRQSLSALFLGSIPRFLLSCFRVCFKESFLRLEVDPLPCCLGGWCVIRSITCV